MKGLNDITNSCVIRNCLRKHIGRELRDRSSQKIIDRNVKVVCQPDQLFNIRIVNAFFIIRNRSAGNIDDMSQFGLRKMLLLTKLHQYFTKFRQAHTFFRSF